MYIIVHCFNVPIIQCAHWSVQCTDLDILDSSEGSKQLPEDILLGLRRQVVDKDAPARAIGGHPRQQRVARQKVPSQRGESAKTTHHYKRSGVYIITNNLIKLIAF